MSTRVTEWCWEHSESTGTDRLVLIAIGDQASHEGLNAYPSYATLAARCKVSVKTVQRSVAKLEALGELAVDRRAGPSREGKTNQRPNVYSFPEFRIYAGHETRQDVASSTPDRTEEATSGTEEATSRAQRGDKFGRRGDTAVTSDPVFDPSSVDPVFDSGGGELFTVPATKIKTPKRATETEAPDSFDLSLTLRSWFKEQNLPRLGIDARFETDKFLDHHRAKGTKFRNWDAAWKNWMRNAGKFAQERGPVGNAARPGGDKGGSGQRYARHFEHIPDEAYAAPMNY